MSTYSPRGEQATAIEQLVAGLHHGEKHQVLLSGASRSYRVGQNLHNCQGYRRGSTSPIVLAHNKTHAAQLYSEIRGSFPQNAVEYFVSCYDYYQPEAYIAHTDTQSRW